MKPNRTSTNNNRNNYQKLSWWMRPENQFWNNGLYSQESRDYFNEWLARWNKKEKSLVNRTENINRNQ